MNIQHAPVVFCRVSACPLMDWGLGLGFYILVTLIFFSIFFLRVSGAYTIPFFLLTLKCSTYVHYSRCADYSGSVVIQP